MATHAMGGTYGNGTVFKLSQSGQSGKENILYSFTEGGRGKSRAWFDFRCRGKPNTAPL